MNNTDALLFSSLSSVLRDELLTNLVSLNFNQMTPIQAKALPLMLGHSDVIAQAETGSGKTAAFGLTVLNSLNTAQHAVQALILCPTRELAEQVSQVLRRLARLLPNVKVLNLSGGIPMRPQLDSLKHGTHIIVGTPGRVQKHLDLESLALDNLNTLVLDEADRMLDMGFEEAIKRVISFCPSKRQTLLFSATYPEQIEQIACDFMYNPTRVATQKTQNTLDITQQFYEVSEQTDKLPLLKSLLYHHQPTSTLIFCNTKDQTMHLSTRLTKEGFSAIALNGDMEQAARDLAMIRFANRSCSILVATDVAARGLDIKELPAVINYDLAFEYDIHLHRIGRTGRAGHKGLALTLTIPADAERLCAIENNSTVTIPWADTTELNRTQTTINKPDMVTLSLTAGRKDKIRPGDILGALTQDAGLNADDIGKIDISALHSYVAIQRNQLNKAYHFIKNGKLKGRKVNIKLI
ncbi:MAG: ATP-dependent RNA helicase DbpA [Gammaproteobacteria bacterium]|nr:ATP-dependent RNA helicase DbpA [Gammaproteobacteria bacterium]MCH9763429.1 ATP-dependent RNA helicase DbpA [Gammaproteobacteria bacterium]